MKKRIIFMLITNLSCSNAKPHITQQKTSQPVTVMCRIKSINSVKQKYNKNVNQKHNKKCDHGSTKNAG